MKNNDTKVTDLTKTRFKRHSLRLVSFAKAKHLSMQRVYKLRHQKGYKGLCTLYSV